MMMPYGTSASLTNGTPAARRNEISVSFHDFVVFSMRIS